MLDIVQVTKRFGKGAQAVTAIRDVSLTLQRDEIFALAGESGSGKSTLAEMIIGLQQPTSGSIVWDGDHGNVDKRSEAGRKKAAPVQVQMVFQNPDRSLNPYWKVKDIVTEPLVLSKVPRFKALERAIELLERVKLPASLLERRPSECSGGQKQRIAIARALSMSPQLLIADEITSALDPSTKEEILRLLVSLKHEQRMSILYITHQLETVAGFADRMAVMKSGVIVETGTAEQVLSAPRCAYTRALIEACSYSS